MLKKWLVAMLGATAMAASAGALAQKQQAATQGFYVGGDIGKFDIDTEDDTAFKIFGGYQINRHFAAEFGYSSLFDKNGGEITAWELVGVGMYPLGNNFSIFGKLGLAKWDASACAFGICASDNGTDLTFGVGVQYDLNPKFAIRGQWQRYDIDSEDGDLFSIGVIYKF
jgi:opacity protein-like surface antigen